MVYLDEYGIRIDDVQNAADINEKDYSQAITDKVTEYVADDSDLDDAIINDESILRAMRALYRAHVNNEHHIMFTGFAVGVCMHIDSYLINRATKEIG